MHNLDFRNQIVLLRRRNSSHSLLFQVLFQFRHFQCGILKIEIGNKKCISTSCSNFRLDQRTFPSFNAFRISSSRSPPLWVNFGIFALRDDCVALDAGLFAFGGSKLTSPNRSITSRHASSARGSRIGMVVSLNSASSAL